MADRVRRIALAAIALPLLFLAMSGIASAAILTVTSNADSGAGTLRNQVATASSGDTINFAVAGPIVLASIIQINVDLTIAGPSTGIEISGNNAVGVMSVNLVTLTLNHLIITGSNSDDAAIVNTMGSLFVDDCTFSNNTGSTISDDGESAATTMITNSTFANNTGDNVIRNFSNILIVTNSTFSGNTTPDNGGTAISAGGLETLITNCTFSGNTSPQYGSAALRNFRGHTVSVRGSIFSHNSYHNCASPITNAGYNISDDDSCGFTMAPSGTSINNSTTLNLDPAGLQNNGGPTQTIALEDDSEAVHFIPVLDCTDQESPPMQLTTDQRGFPRPDPGNPNFCDAGAFELQTMPIVISASGERLQIVHSSTPSGNLLNTSFTFTELGFPACDAGDDPFNGIGVAIEPGSCAASGPDAIGFFLNSWAVQTVNHQIYGTLSSIDPPENLTVRMVELPTPTAPACGEWTINLEFTGVDLTPFGDGPFALILRNPDGDAGCFDITNAIVGNQIDPPTRTVRRGVRR